ncbi:amidase [Sneathiella sp. CAU 1612]|uniref:Amidase n=1 Tax=Sneathiella sedimenti TaxID=2816034 RepID=A0ABS3F9N0_9PROT|nr:amidase [Sneathiella sedimenti]MBO0335042.1 amidase [Sneathiella sedimenti]
MNNDLAFATATELLDGYRDGAISPVEATKAALAQIEKYNGALNAFVLVDEDYALARARESETRWRAGTPIGLIDGIPTTIKDILLTEGWPTLRGSLSVDAAGPWNDDAPCTARLKEQGAVIIGKTTTPEFGWKGVTDSPRTGITRNPWNKNTTPGGSSGGASAACAAGMGVFHVGTDGGGSIRIPSSFTGIFGIKASYGRVPAWPLSPFGTVAHVGPMTRTVRDSAIMLQVMSRPDVRDWTSLPPTDTDYLAGLSASIRGKKIAYSPALGYASVHPEVAAAVKSAVLLFEDLGAIVEEVDPGFENPLPIFNTLWWSGAAFALRNLSDKQLDELDPGLRTVVEEGAKITLTDYLEANQARGDLGIKMRKFHETYDLLVTPALCIPAFEAGKLAPDDLAAVGAWVDWTPFSYPFNLTQQPACSINCGFSSEGLPIGLQIVGPMQDDLSVLNAAFAFEQVSPVAGARPELEKLL